MQSQIKPSVRPPARRQSVLSNKPVVDYFIIMKLMNRLPKLINNKPNLLSEYMQKKNKINLIH